MPRNYQPGTGKTGRKNHSDARGQAATGTVPTQRDTEYDRKLRRERQAALLAETRRKLAEKKGEPVAGPREVKVARSALADQLPGVHVDRVLEHLKTDDTGHIKVLTVPDEVPQGMTRAEWLEQKAAACEKLMLQGVRDERLLTNLLGVPRPTADLLVKRVLARWTALGGESDLRQSRGEALVHYEMIINELWGTYRAVENKEGGAKGGAPFQKTMILQHIMSALERKMELQGLSSQNVEMLLHVSDDAEVVQRIRKHAIIGEFAAKLLDRISSARQKQSESAGKIQEAVIVEP